MRMLVTREFADAGTTSGTHRLLIIGRDTDNLQAGDIGPSLDEANCPHNDRKCVDRFIRIVQK